MTVYEMWKELSKRFKNVRCYNDMSPNNTIYSKIEDLPPSLGELPEYFVTFFEYEKVVEG